MRESLVYLWVSVVQTLLRMLPFPCRTGLVVIGDPGPDAPVLLTCNFRLTVERVKRALRGQDVYLLVANSRGVNVWCAATGGLLGNHDVISVLKTSGVAERVRHRRVVLPQLAATGVEGRVVQQATGWRIHWGPVRAEDLPRFLGAGMEASQEMRAVDFPWRERLEMGVAWAFPISLAGALLSLAFVELPHIAAGVALVWAAALALFLAFPLYQGGLPHPGARRGSGFPGFGRFGAPLLLWGVFVAALLGYGAATGQLGSSLVLQGAGLSLVVLMLLGVDLMGSTPTFKSGLHADRLLAIELDAERCKGAAFCEQVCPTRVFEMDATRRLALLPRAEACVQCGACVVQCPFDALRFRAPDGSSLEPETVRRFKLNLAGKRSAPARS